MIPFFNYSADFIDWVMFIFLFYACKTPHRYDNFAFRVFFLCHKHS